jgi:hypothetical protein
VFWVNLREKIRFFYEILFQTPWNPGPGAEKPHPKKQESDPARSEERCGIGIIRRSGQKATPGGPMCFMSRRPDKTPHRGGIARRKPREPRGGAGNRSEENEVT